jgi:hypothetical protein
MGFLMEKAKGPNADLLMELALEDRELMIMLPINGRSRSPKPS